VHETTQSIRQDRSRLLPKGEAWRRFGFVPGSGYKQKAAGVGSDNRNASRIRNVLLDEMAGKVTRAHRAAARAVIVDGRQDHARGGRCLGSSLRLDDVCSRARDR
jgi:hypothetical protein